MRHLRLRGAGSKLTGSDRVRKMRPAVGLRTLFDYGGPIDETFDHCPCRKVGSIAAVVANGQDRERHLASEIVEQDEL